MLFVERSDVYFHISSVTPFKIIIDKKEHKYFLVFPSLDYKLGCCLSGLFFDNNKNIIFIVSESLNKYIREIIVKEYIYLLQSEKVDEYNLVTYLKEKNCHNIEYLFDLAINYCEKCRINPKTYIMYKLSTFLDLADEMEAKNQDITYIQKAIDFLTENLECFICEYHEDQLVKS